MTIQLTLSKELRKLVNDEDVGGLASHDGFNLLIDNAIEQFEKSGKTTSIHYVLSTFEKSFLYLGLLVYFSQRVGLSYRWRPGTKRLVLKIDTSQLAGNPDLITILQKYRGKSEELRSKGNRNWLKRKLRGQRKQALKKKRRKTRAAALAELKPLVSSVDRIPKKKKKKRNKKKGIDAMSRRLPGSFETGKRR